MLTLSRRDPFGSALRLLRMNRRGGVEGVRVKSNSKDPSTEYPANLIFISILTILFIKWRLFAPKPLLDTNK